MASSHATTSRSASAAAPSSLSKARSFNCRTLSLVVPVGALSRSGSSSPYVEAMVEDENPVLTIDQVEPLLAFVTIFIRHLLIIRYAADTVRCGIFSRRRTQALSRTSLHRCRCLARGNGGLVKCSWYHSKSSPIKSGIAATSA